jgi:hypothetical protein
MPRSIEEPTPVPDSFPLTSEDASPRLQLPYLAAGQAQKHVTVNEALAMLDGLIQTAVESATTAAEPAAPPEGALYILPPGRAGPEWALHPAGSLLRYADQAWTRLAANDGTIVYAKDAGAVLFRAGGAWKPIGAALGHLQNVSRLGLGTEADATNPLAARLNKALFTAKEAGQGGDGDLRLTFNKETSADVLSLLFQSGFVGRAELGLVGDDRLTLKTSVDGAAWTTALVVDGQGRPRWPAAPAFGGWISGSRVSAGPFSGYTAWSKSVNRGGCFQPSTGVFTAPVGGAYVFHLIGKSNSASTALGVFELRVNGQALAEEMVETHGPFQELGASRVFDLAAGDTVHAHLTYTDDPQASLQAVLSGHLIG